MSLLRLAQQLVVWFVSSQAALGAGVGGAANAGCAVPRQPQWYHSVLASSAATAAGAIACGPSEWTRGGVTSANRHMSGNDGQHEAWLSFQ